jgi:hypothetical protein
MDKHELLYRVLRALLVWVFLTWVLLVWNIDFHPFNPDTWWRYRVNHSDKLVFSLLLFGIVTYFAVESIGVGSKKKRTLDFDTAMRAGTLLLVVVFLWMFSKLPQELGSSISHLAVTVDGAGSLSDPVKLTLGGDVLEPLNVEIIK